jgi:hypothetical protein
MFRSPWRGLGSTMNDVPETWRPIIPGLGLYSPARRHVRRPCARLLTR